MTRQQMLEDIEAQLEKLKMPDGYFNAGIPNYEHLFGRDACVSALQLVHRSPEAGLATLEVLAKFQGRQETLWREEYPGKILHEHFPGGASQRLSDLVRQGDRLRQSLSFLFWGFPYYGSVDAGAWYLMLLHHYWAQTGDEDVVRRFWPVALGIIGWLDKHADHTHTGLVGFRRHYIFGLHNQSWKDNLNLKMTPPVAMVEVQGYYYYALGLAAELARDVMGDHELVAAIQKRADLLKERFHTYFKPADGSYPLAIDGQGRPVRSVTSNPGQLLFTGILDKREADMVVARLMRDDMMTPYGIRTESSREPDFKADSYQNGSVWPFDNWVIQQGLEKTGHKKEADEIEKALTNIFEMWGNLPEAYSVTGDEARGIKSACRIQAWSAGALVNLLTDAPLL